MKLQLLCVGQKMPAWVTTGFEEFSRRFPRDLPLELHEISAGKRGKNANAKRIVQDEGDKLLARIPKGARVVALEVGGRRWSTGQLAERLEFWKGQGGDVAFLIGGPEGLSDACRSRADEQWSLSDLTLPHPLVRVVVAEALYRAWSITANHPYHRA